MVSLPILEHAASQMFLAMSYPEIAREVPTTIAEFAHWLEIGSLFVAVDDSDQSVGYAIVHELDGDAYLHEIDVHPDHVRWGIGRRLIDEVHRWAVERGYHRVVLSTFADVPWNAPYYARLGFREIPSDQLSSALVEIRRREQTAGLNVARRMFMASPVSQPNEQLHRSRRNRCS